MTTTNKDQCKNCKAINVEGAKIQWCHVAGLKYCGCCGRRQGR